jgi:uncharacterized NAD(P)/FAD-binding protein YdhS
MGLARLREKCRVRLVRGKVIGVDRSGARFRVVSQTPGGVGVADGAVFADCAGFVGPARSADPLLRHLLREGTASANATAEGLRVNERFEAAPRLFVQGALLVGLSRGTDHIWHFDSNFRISIFAIRMVAHLGRAIAERARAAEVNALSL